MSRRQKTTQWTTTTVRSTDDIPSVTMEELDAALSGVDWERVLSSLDTAPLGKAIALRNELNRRFA